MAHRPYRKTLVLFSSYFSQEKLPNYIRRYLEGLLPHAYKVVLITQQDRKISAEGNRWLESKNIELMYVQNQGMDFGMWSKACQRWHTEDYDSLILANDSCLSIRDFSGFFFKATQSSAQLVGMTDSMKKGHHLQSYFLLAKSKACAGEIVDFIESKRHFLETTEKYTDIVNTCEIGLSQHIKKKGFGIQAIWPFAHGDPLFDPSYVLAHSNAKQGMPLIKKKALIANSNKALRFQAYNQLDVWPVNIVNDLINNHACQVSEQDEIHALAEIGNAKVAARKSMLKRIRFYRRFRLFRKKYLIPSCQS